MTPKKQTVYVPIPVMEEMPIKGQLVSVSFDGGILFSYEATGKGWKPNEVNYTHWLKPSEGYFFTPQDLLSLKRKWAGEAWDVADPVKRVFEDLMHRGQSEVIHMAKETYLNNLKIDG